MDQNDILLAGTLVAALGFAWTNGFNDAAHAIATSVNNRALTPRHAVAVSAGLNLVGALLGEGLARTISGSLFTLPAGDVGVRAVFGALLAAIGWNVLMWSRGVPSSSSQALIGGLTGAAIAVSAGVDGSVLVRQALLPLLVSPLLGAVLGVLVMAAVLRLFSRVTYSRALARFRIAQAVSASAVALGHGLQDGQKTMGVMVLALAAAGGSAGAADGIPWWVQLSAGLALAAGTYAGGWRIVRTVGRRIVRVDPVTGFVAESVSASLLYVSAYVFNAPVSTTHTVVSAITGAGSVGQGVRAIRWRTWRPIAGAWVVTLPVTGVLGFSVTVLLGLLGS